MKKGRYTEEQIAFALQQAEHGISVVEVCWKKGVTERSFYRIKGLHCFVGFLLTKLQNARTNQSRPEKEILETQRIRVSYSNT